MAIMPRIEICESAKCLQFSMSSRRIELRSWSRGFHSELERGPKLSRKITASDTDFFFFLSSCHEKATEALCIGRIQARLGVAIVSEVSA